MTRSAFVVAVLTVLCAASSASAAAFEDLMRQAPAVVIPQTQLAPVQGVPLQQPAEDESFISFSILSTLPAPDPKVAAWLASRIPGLDTAALKEVPESAADSVLQRALAAKATYLEVFTDPGLGSGNPELYYLSQDVLNRLHAKWISGTLPVKGVTTGGQPFQMQALVVGKGSVNILYNFSSFEFKDADNQYGITGNGRVMVNALGRSDVGVSGVRARGCMGSFCGWADIQRITKTGPNTVRVKTSRKTVDAPIKPVRRR